MVDENTRIASQISIILQCEKFWQGELAAKTLGRIGDAAIPALLPLMEQDSNVLFYTVMALVQIGSPAALAILTQAVNDNDYPHRKTVIWCLGERGNNQIIPILTPLVEDQKESIRQAAIISLGLLQDSSIIPLLCEIVQSQNEAVRSNAVRALGRIGDISTVVVLSKASHDTNKKVREEAAWAMKQLGDEKVLPRRILAETRFSLQQRIDALESLRDACYEFNAFGSTTPYRFPSLCRLCRIVLTEEDATVRQGAQEILDFLDSDTFLRASQADSETDRDELLRSVQNDNPISEDTSLLYPLDALLTKPARSASLWERLFGQRDGW